MATEVAIYIRDGTSNQKTETRTEQKALQPLVDLMDEQEPQTKGALIFPRAIMRVRREEDSPSIEKETPHAGFKEDHSIVNHEHNLGNNEADSPDMIIQSAGNLYPVTEQEEDLYSSLSDDLSELSVLCDMEFSHDYRTFFEKHLKTLPSVGPPSVLAYKRESSENHRLLAMMKILREQSEKELCEFCGKTLKPFPLEHTIDKEFSNEIFCCRQFRNMFRYLFKEDERLFHKDKIELISVAPHGPYGSEVERQKAKEKTAQRLRERHMAKVFESIVAEPTIVNEYGRPMKTISYQLSSAPPVGDSWTIPPDNEDAKSDADSIDQEPVVYDFSNDTILSSPARPDGDCWWKPFSGLSSDEYVIQS
ncbi:glutamate-rich protein 6 isoform X4 [Hyla sarda]|uniref:glutamate-rich protein 6 isoform X4 n=1 Tax=Hyla sarda TaxID=327740 RepID=UPI0024C316C4|nr:glutamate-rich protein 6 isoform X4 [Hyla sarda]